MARTAGITGGTGFLGRAVVAAFLDQGWNVRVLARDAARAAKMFRATRERATIVPGDALDAPSLDTLLDGADVGVSLVGIIREAGPQTFQRIHADAPRALAAACLRHGVRRLVHVSAIGVGRNATSEYARSKRRGEEAIIESDLDWTILRPGLIHGPEGEFVRLVKGWVTRSAPPYHFLPYFTRGVDDSGVFMGPITREVPRVAPVWVKDVAGAVVRVIDEARTIGEIYNLVGPEEMSFPEMLRAFRDAIPEGDEKIQPMGVPSEAAGIVAMAASKLGLDSLLPFDAGMAAMGAEDASASIDKAEADFGFAPRGFRSELSAYAAKI